MLIKLSFSKSKLRFLDMKKKEIGAMEKQQRGRLKLIQENSTLTAVIEDKLFYLQEN